MTLSPVVLSRGVLHAAGPYRCPIVRVRGRVVATNYPPHGAFRGFGAPQTTFAYERQLQIKSLVIADALRRIGRLPLAHAVSVAASPAEGYRMRVYVPFGREWFPYFMRRLGERPANVGFLIRSLVAER